VSYDEEVSNVLLGVFPFITQHVLVWIAVEYPHSMHLFQSMTQRMNGVVNQNMDQAWRRLMTQVLPLLPHKLHICQDIAVQVGWSGDIGPYCNDLFGA
jgi:hypothetical protein